MRLPVRMVAITETMMKVMNDVDGSGAPMAAEGPLDDSAQVHTADRTVWGDLLGSLVPAMAV